MDSNKTTTQAFITVLFSAILHTALLLIIIGIPVRQFFSQRDPEALEYQKQKSTIVEQPIRPAVTHDLADIPAPTQAPAPVPKKAKSTVAKVKAPVVEKAEKPEEKVEEKQPKIVDVNFDKDEKTALAKVQDQKPEEKTDDETAATAEAPKQEPATETQVTEVQQETKDPKAESEAVIEEDSQPTPEPKAEPLKQAVEKSEKPKPVVEKFAGVEAAEDDTATEATSTDANPTAPDADASKVMDSEGN